MEKKTESEILWDKIDPTPSESELMWRNLSESNTNINLNEDIKVEDYKDELQARLYEYEDTHPDCHTTSKFCHKIGIDPGQLTRFFQNKTSPLGLERENMVRLCFALGYHAKEIESMLHRFNLPELDVRKKEERNILYKIEDKNTTIEEMDELLTTLKEHMKKKA